MADEREFRKDKARPVEEDMPSEIEGRDHLISRQRTMRDEARSVRAKAQNDEMRLKIISYKCSAD